MTAGRERWRAWGAWLFQLCVSLSVPLAMVAFSLRVLISSLYLDIWWFVLGGQAEIRPHFPSLQWRDLAWESTRFIARRAPASDLEALRLVPSEMGVPMMSRDPSLGSALYTAEEIAHLVDVQAVMLRILGMGAVAAFVLVVSFMLARRSGMLEDWSSALASGARWLLGLLLLLGAGIGLAWDAVFTGMHRLLFEDGTWQFSADSRLIQLFPGGFWFDSALVLVLMLVLQAFCVLVLARWIRKRVSSVPQEA